MVRRKMELRLPATFATAMLGFPFRSQLSPLRTSFVVEVGRESGHYYSLTVKTTACFAVCGQTNWLSQFKVDSICLPMFPHCGSFSIGLCRALPYAKLSGTNPEIGTCRGNFSINRLLVEPLIARPLTDSHGNSCLMTVA